MNKDHSLEQKTADIVDNYVIGASIALLASFSIFGDTKDFTGKSICFFVLSSVISFSLALILCLWHKIRFSHRHGLFENEKERIIREYAKEITEVGNKVIIPYQQVTGKQDIPENDPCFKIIHSFCKNMGNEMNEANDKCFQKPLKERFGLIKYYIDCLAGKFRYIIFTLGIFCYCGMVFLRFFIQKT